MPGAPVGPVGPVGPAVPFPKKSTEPNGTQLPPAHMYIRPISVVLLNKS